ncbi:Gfo/Idh/MocA family oxidoreductase [Thalassospira sp. GB04J01]|uniref:Gfo/Idh/MocA family protein n=1 Tax=Thalassospira sp. GB04J01 TaxID=1485225 RepID=UPI000C9D05FB|nr:Gfo/Idh/MocA family oxidoreductase [Thalassospira sp. GB04J01]|tara:strand:- start:63334 stop:64428 length:1095 start_codon:yes stop_codon:yes gene_type:complete
MFKIKIHGCGSIGNHLAQASRTLGWSVDMCDIDPAALNRTKNSIYPSRYGAWDEEIRLFESGSEPKEGYDIIVIGTPPDVHVELAMEALSERPKAIIIEKPICGPGLEGADALANKARELGVYVFSGYDHVVGQSAEKFSSVIDEKCFGELITLDVEFREHWAGIFGAHPWLSGPQDTYLGYFKRGGGASGEHSHALNLWQHFAHAAGKGRVVRVSSQMQFVKDGDLEYDRLCFLSLETESGFIGRVIQDVVTLPARKWARAQHVDGAVEWQCGSKPGCDEVREVLYSGQTTVTEVKKTRPDDFIKELRHIRSVLDGDIGESPISLERGLDTMLVLAAAHLSAKRGASVTINWDKGYVPEALTF